ncbi:nucleotidyltransferase family protein [Candidatus Uhrbacteria bacterium]|nr:nucleotidyltransferase family protein [Candidatus Uhrbacteria bacterium]
MPPHIERLKAQVTPKLRAAGVKRAAVFGSFARGEAGSESDVDLLIEPPRGMTLFDFVRLKNELEDILRTEVDLVSYRGLSPHLRDRILESTVTIL